jgi:hypothetical protein
LEIILAVTMASTSPVFLRLMANAVAVANHAGKIKLGFL